VQLRRLLDKISFSFACRRGF